MRPTPTVGLPALLLSVALACAPGDDAAAPEAAASSPVDVTAEDDRPVEAVSLLDVPLRRPALPAATQAELEAELQQAQARLAANPGDEEAIIWVGRRLAYLGRYNDAVDTFTEGLEAHPDSYRLLRHRGHRFITLRRFGDAIADLGRAAELMPAEPLETEPDGAPNALGIPLSSTQFNVWYHLALAHYLSGEYEAALEAWERCMEVSVNPDLLVAASDWMYMTLRRLGRHDEAAALLQPITADLEIIENDAYHRRLLMYKGEVAPEELLDLRVVDDPDQALQIATQGYGVGNWYLAEGDEERAQEIFERILDGTSWAAFGTIAAEADVARMRDAGEGASR